MRAPLVFMCLSVCGLAPRVAVAVELQPLTQKNICTGDEIDRNKVVKALVDNLTLADLKEKTKTKSVVPTSDEVIAYAATYPVLAEFLDHHDPIFYGIKSRRGSEGCSRPSDSRERDFLANPACFVATCKKGIMASTDAPTAKTADFPGQFRLRRNAENLRTKLTSKSVDDNKTVPATFSLTRDIEQNSTIAQAELAAGLAFEGHLTQVERADGKIEDYNPYTVIPYLSYHRIGSDPKKSNDINNLGVGLLFNTTLATTGPLTHEITLKGQYTTDEDRRSSIASGEAIYYPIINLDPSFDPFGGVAWSGPIGVYIEPSVPVRYSQVFDPGDNLALQNTKEYLFAGGQIMMVLAGNPEIVPAFFQNFKWRFQYIWLHGFEGPHDTFERFESELNYTFTELRNFGVGLKYVNGDADITLQETESVQGTFNVKF